MKKIVKFIGLLILILFSFFYTDKVTHVIRENDSLMTEIVKTKSKYKVTPTEGIINNNTIIPGINGRSINIDKSYKKMRERGIFDENLIEYNKIAPKINLEENKDKFIISGNVTKKMVSIILILSDDKYLDIIENSITNNNIIINYFVDYNYLLNNSPKIKSLNNCEVYNYGNDGEYTPDNILFANNLINRIRNNKAIYCLTTSKSLDTIKLCSNNNLNTILPSIIVNNNSYNEIKKELKSGSIILIELNNNNAIELNIIINYIKGKGLKIVGLSELLSE
ncbi:MAG: hypothetical protein IKF19_06955 [Bacilli bacterium]|nr:hypothetical protein [Bacilli bacterium]